MATLSSVLGYFILGFWATLSWVFGLLYLGFLGYFISGFWATLSRFLGYFIFCYLYLLAELELEQDDDVSDKHAGDGEPAGVAQLKCSQGRYGAILENLSA